MKRKHKTYSKPKRPFDKIRIQEEAKIKEEFGLKNKREIWKTEAKIKSIRERAKRLISADEKEKEAFFDRLGKIGIIVNSPSYIVPVELENKISLKPHKEKKAIKEEVKND